MSSNSRKSSKVQWIAAVGSAVAVATGTATIFWAGSQLLHRPTMKTTSDTIQWMQSIESLRNAHDQQETVVENVSSRVNAITKLPPESQTAVQIAAMKADFVALDKRLKAIEEAVVDSPGKALSVPLLRQELETFKVDTQKGIDSQTKQIDRIYDQNKWFIGLMFTMAIGLIGLAVSNFLQARKVGA